MQRCNADINSFIVPFTSQSSGLPSAQVSPKYDTDNPNFCIIIGGKKRIRKLKKNKKSRKNKKTKKRKY